MGFVGTEAAIAYADFVENYETIITAEDVIDRFSENKERIENAVASDVAALTDKIAEHCKNEKWKASQAKNVAGFANAVSGEQLVSLWNACSQTQNLPNIQKLHKLIGTAVVKAVQASRNA
jgi:hypothetical protein